MSDVSSSIDKLKGSYGGSDKTSPSFLRPEFVKYNSPAKAKNFGSVGNLSTTVTGKLGSEDGANTLYFKVVTQGESDLRITKNSLNKHEDKYIAVGLLDGEYNQLPLNNLGFTFHNEIINTIPLEATLQQPQGTYYFTITNSQWQSLPFSANIQVIRYILIYGDAIGSAELSGRIALVKLYGLASGTSDGSLTLQPVNQLKVLNGLSSQQALPTATITIMTGTATLQNATFGRIMMVWRIEGVASGSNTNTATLTVTSPGGGY